MFECALAESQDRLSLLKHIVEEVGHYLPTQGPVKTFVHHNTLHHFEEQHFFDAVDSAASIYGAQTALPESSYQGFLKQGRIAQSDINRALIEYGVDGSPWLLGGSQRKFIRSLMYAAPEPLTSETLRWRLLERGYLERFHEDVAPPKISRMVKMDEGTSSQTRIKWIARYREIARDWDLPWLVEMLEPMNQLSEPQSWSTRHTLALQWIAAVILADRVHERPEASAHESMSVRANRWVEELINPYLIKFTSSFLDAGLAHLTIADRSHGLLQAFLAHIRNDSVARPPWLRADLRHLDGRLGLEVLLEQLDVAGVDVGDWKKFLLEKALVLKGWGGLVYQTERGVSGVSTRTTLADFLAARLILEGMAREYFTEHPQFVDVPGTDNSPLGVGELLSESSALHTTAYHLFHAFQTYPCSGSELLSLDEQSVSRIVAVVVEYDTRRRLRVWHSAYEWNLYSRAASALVHHNTSRWMGGEKAPRNVACQLVCCIDDREESFRRYLEELNDDYETFGTAGFFGVDAEFHSLYEQAAPYCPANITPTHFVEILPKEGSERRLLGFLKLKTRASDVSMFVENQSRSLVRGWLLALGGLLALIPLSLSTLFPHWMHRVRVYLTRRLINPAEESAIMFADDGNDAGEGRFTLDEMALRVKTLLVSTGLGKQLAPVVVIMGHGSFSTNNPYRSAYDCGACGGRPGRLNSRVFALMANRPDVRQRVRESGLDIPDTTYFVGAFHNTCTDAVEYFDLEALPASHRKVFERFSADVDTARTRNALERCRRFDDAHVRSESEAISHVESRAHHIAQPRPEYGHATNALCVVGRREITKGLFLDRRAFLVSYDKTVDPEVTALRNLLRAVIPVCMGISLEYLFSAVDNQKYGAGTKLPHNVTSLLGLMTGYCSDLRTGLPAQMVEIHEPTRLLVVIDQEPEKIQTIIDTEVDVGRAIKNHWVTLMAYVAERNELYLYDHTNRFSLFEEMTVGLAKAPDSLSWVAGKKHHLDFVQIGA
jgi:uncharacterized protein YbcC (UPF0753/DUF2309 family)